MRLSVMELGRFKWRPRARVEVLLALSALYAPVDFEVVLFHVEQFRSGLAPGSLQGNLFDLPCFPELRFAENYSHLCIPHEHGICLGGINILDTHAQ